MNQEGSGAVKIFIKMLVIMLILALVFGLEFFWFGDRVEQFFSQQRCVEFFGGLPLVAWAIAIFFLVLDLFLPIPATGIMAALGSFYGVWWGGVISLIGSVGSGLLGFMLARYGGKRLLGYLATEEERERFTDFFERWGGFAIIASRSLPILPEVIAILAGLATMSFLRFFASLLLGTMPVSFLFAYIGYASQSAPVYGLLLAVFLPLLIWSFFLKMVALRSPENP